MIIFQDYCHLYFAGDISKLGYLDEEMEQVHTLSWTDFYLHGYYSSMEIPTHRNHVFKTMCWILGWVFSKKIIKTPGRRQLTSFCCVYSKLWTYLLQYFPIISFFKVNNGNKRTMWEICLKLTTIKKPEDVTDVVLGSLLLTLNRFHTVSLDLATFTEEIFNRKHHLLCSLTLHQWYSFHEKRMLYEVSWASRIKEFN